MSDMDLATRLGIELPIIQAPMAGVQGSALAIAVSNAGGLGSLGCALLSPDVLRAELAAIRAHTPRPYNLNFFCHSQPSPDAAREARWRAALARYAAELGIAAEPSPAGPARAPFTAEIAELIEPFAPPVVSFHFGLPAPELVQRIKRWGAKVLCSATTVEEARHLEARGVDVIIAQGLEAGGHRGMFLSEDLGTQLGTLALVPQIVATVRVPVVAAGGIADAAGAAAARALGAAGVQVGTAYLLCPEASTGPLYRAAIAHAAGRASAITNVFTGRPARALVNRAVAELGPMSPIAPPFPLAADGIALLRAAAERQGSDAFSPLWCGQNPSGCRAAPAAEITRAIAAGLRP
jgi:nitronate monooxygenase